MHDEASRVIEQALFGFQRHVKRNAVKERARMIAAASNKKESQFGGKSHARQGTAEKWGECKQVRNEARVRCDGW